MQNTTEQKNNFNFWKFMRNLEPLILLALIVSLIVFCVIIQRESSKCVANPLIYGANKIYQGNDQNIQCTCQIPENPKFYYGFNRSSWWQDTTGYKQSEGLELNLNSINIVK